MPRSRSFLPIAQALRTCVTKFFLSVSLPIADPPPVGGHTGATSDPTARPFDPILSASAFRSLSLASMLTCGSKRNRSTPSNFVPSTFALAVRSSIVSRSIAGSAPGLPLPTRPGHIALWSLGYAFMIVLLSSLIVLVPSALRSRAFADRSCVLRSRDRCVGVARAEVFQDDERVGFAPVLDAHAGFGRRLA